jgi:hypothetical protein
VHIPGIFVRHLYLDRNQTLGESELRLSLPTYLVLLDYHFLCISLKSYRQINGLGSASTS